MQPKTPQASGAVQPLDDFLNDPWTDEQEIQLLKSMMYSKPTGDSTALMSSSASDVSRHT